MQTKQQRRRGALNRRLADLNKHSTTNNTDKADKAAKDIAALRSKLLIKD